jgi:DNA-binding LacI/PurR family transcriptional regulator
VELLLRRIEDPDAEPDAVVLATSLVVRASCGCAEPARGSPTSR